MRGAGYLQEGELNETNGPGEKGKKKIALRNLLHEKDRCSKKGTENWSPSRP